VTALFEVYGRVADFALALTTVAIRIVPKTKAPHKSIAQGRRLSPLGRL
jgi:hypothetical protein